MKFVIAFIALIVVLGALACPIDFPKAVFVYARHPDFPRTEYAAGRLGVVEPAYGVSYLAVAYRYFAGRPLNALEREQLLDYWKDRETGDWDNTATFWVERWDRARTRVPGARATLASPTGQGRYAYSPSTNSFLLNCAEDAYRTAYRTLEARSAQFGLASPAVRGWRDAQDQVFRNCTGATGELPQPAAATVPALIRADREYQIAAARFYSQQHDEAVAAFRKIAADSASPWRTISRYLVARTLTRAAAWPEAEREARAILADPKLIEIHGMTRVLLHRMILKQSDETYFHELSRDLTGGHAGRSLREEMWAYSTLYARFDGQPAYYYQEPQQKPPDHIVFTRDELSDWVHAFSDDDALARSRSLSRWRQTHSVPWLIAALRHATGKQPHAADLIDAAGDIPENSPAFITTSYHRLRLLREQGRGTEVRDAADHLLAMKVPKSSANTIRGLRMMASPTLAEFFQFAARRPVRIVDHFDSGEVWPWKEPLPLGPVQGKDLFDRDSIKVLNERTPLRVLTEAALGKAMPPYHERDFVLVAYTRAVLLNDAQRGIPLAARLRELGADQQNHLAAYETAKDEQEREFAGVFYLLHHNEARTYLASGLGRMERPGDIAASGDNWWCPIDMEVELDSRVNLPRQTGTWEYQRREDPDGSAWRASFLSEADREEARREIAQLAKTKTASDYFFKVLKSFGEAHRADPRMPEAYYLTFHAHHWGCVRRETMPAALEAWRTMWRYYPRSAWTKKAMVFDGYDNVPQAAGSTR